MQAKHGLEFPLVEASAEDVPLPGRVLRPRRLRVRRLDLGRPVPLDPGGVAAAAPGRRARLPRQRHDPRRSAVQEQEIPPDEQLRRPYFGMHRFEWPRRSGRRLPPRLRRLDQAPARERLRGRGPDRVAGAGGCATAPSTTRCQARVGAEVAVRGDLARAQDRVSVPPAPPLILASTSPRRREILEQLRIPFVVRAAVATRRRDGDPVAHAVGKAESVLAAAGDQPVLGCDTEVVCDGRVYGKPENQADAEAMLESLAGKTHEVVSGLALITPGWRGGAPRGDAGHVPAARRRATSRTTWRAASGRDGPARTRSRGSAPRSSSGSRATT